jgi:hypothetical protein
LTWTAFASSGCSVPDLQIVEARDDGMMAAAPPFVPRELPDASPGDRGSEGDDLQAGRSASNVGISAGSAGAAGAAGRGSTGSAGASGTTGAAGAAISGSGGAAGVSPVEGGTGGMGVDAGPPPVTPPATVPDEPNPCLVWIKASSRDRAPANAVEGGLETTAGFESRQYVCRVQPPDLGYAVPGKAIFGNGCLVVYRLDGSMRVHSQQNGMPFEVLTSGPGCSFAWQSADNSSVPSGALDLGEAPGKKLYACRGDFEGPLSAGVQLGGVQGATDMPPRYECWFESYTSPMQPLNPTLFEVLTHAP